MTSFVAEPLLARPAGPAPAFQAIPAAPVGLTRYGRTLGAHWRLALAIALAVALLGNLYAFAAAPLYEASMLFQLDEQARPDDPGTLLGELASTFDVKNAVGTEIALFGTRHLLAPVVERLGLCIQAEPVYLPVFGPALARGAARDGWLAAALRRARYATGAERIVVGRLDLPAGTQPVALMVSAGADGDYLVQARKTGPRWRARLGQNISLPDEGGAITLRIDILRASPGTRFRLWRIRADEAMDELRRTLVVAEVGNKSGVFKLALRGADPAAVHRALAVLGGEYLRQHRLRKTEDAQRALAMIEQRLPALRAHLEQAESRYDSLRSEAGVMGAPDGRRLELEQMASLRAGRAQLERERADVATRFTARHPRRVALAAQIGAADAALAALALRLARQPGLEQTLSRLQREVQIDQQLYEGLRGAAQRLHLIAIGRAASVRLIDPPQLPYLPLRPPWLLGAVAALLGVSLGMVGAILKQGWNPTMDTAEMIETGVELVLCAEIAHRPAWADGAHGRTRAGSPARAREDDEAMEGLRVFRAVLDFALRQSRAKVVWCGGATAEVGASLIALNLALLMAKTQRRVLLIDTDLRGGRLHRRLGQPAGPGLAELLLGRAGVAQALRHHGGIDFLARGEVDCGAGGGAALADLVFSPRLRETVDTLAPDYDLILFDSGPLLGGAEALVFAGHANLAYLVARAGLSTAGEVTEAVKRMRRAGLALTGVLLTDTRRPPGAMAAAVSAASGRERTAMTGGDQR